MTAIAQRHWPASLELTFAVRQQKTCLVRNAHSGPLRVLKPFYPDGNCCHTYLLHPPGGLVLGDELAIAVKADEDSHVLITTPSAGKVYGVQNANEQQRQKVTIAVADGACVEWLPQETLIFNGANAALQTHVSLASSAQLIFWDVVCLGRPASQLPFKSGECLQSIRIDRDNIPLLIERNFIAGGKDLQQSPWGIDGANSLGTFIATVITTREQRMQLIEQLEQLFVTVAGARGHRWGITQKEGLVIARYLGDSASVCRKGFEFLWQQLRPLAINKEAVAPRIWAT